MKCFHSATPQSACNYTLYKNPEVDKLIDEAGATDDAAKRVELLKQANNIVQDDAPIVVLQLQQGGHGLSALAEGPAAQRDASSPSSITRISGWTLPRRRLSNSVRKDEPPSPLFRAGGRSRSRPALLRPAVARRLLQMVPILLAVAALIFLLFSVIPGTFASSMGDGHLHAVVDAQVVERMNQELRAQRPAADRASANMSPSSRPSISAPPSARASRSPQVIADRLWPSLQLAMAAMLFAMVIGVPLGFARRDQAGQLVRSDRHHAGGLEASPCRNSGSACC